MLQKAAYFLTLGKLNKLMGDQFAFRFDLRIGEPPPFFQSLNEEQIMRYILSNRIDGYHVFILFYFLG
jgi:hypothetical protein